MNELVDNTSFGAVATESAAFIHTHRPASKPGVCVFTPQELQDIGQYLIDNIQTISLGFYCYIHSPDYNGYAHYKHKAVSDYLIDLHAERSVRLSKSRTPVASRKKRDASENPIPRKDRNHAGPS